MKILVYGAGAVGCVLAGRLCQNKHDVYLAAEGSWKDTLAQKGLKMISTCQGIRKVTTVDYPNMVSGIDKNVHYDMIFAAVDADRLEGILDDLAQADTPVVVINGFNVFPEETEKYIEEHSNCEKKVLFSIMEVTGTIKGDAVECFRVSDDFTVGFASKATDSDTDEMLSRLFNDGGVTPKEKMSDYFRSYTAFILPLCYLTYASDCNLGSTTSELRDMCLDAINEARGILESGDCMSDGIVYDENYLFKKGTFARRSLSFILAVLPKIKLFDDKFTGYCQNSVSEIRYIDSQFDRLISSCSSVRPEKFDKLRSMMPSWDTLEEMYSIPVPKIKKSLRSYVAGQLGNPTGVFGEAVAGALNVFNSEMYGEVLSRVKCGSEDSVLDIGYGNGYLIKRIYEKTGASVYGTDISVDMYFQAVRKNKKYIRNGKVRLGVGDCTDLRYRDETFNTVTTVNTIYFWDDTLKGLKEIRRCLKPGGELLVGSYATEYLKKVPYTKTGFKFFEIEDYMRLGKKAGFSRVQVKKICGEKGYVIRFVK